MTISQAKWWKIKIAIHGTEEAVRASMAKNGMKGNKNPTKPKGFAHMKLNDPKRLEEISRNASKKPRQNTKQL